MIPIRCFSCGKPIGHLHEEYKERSAHGEDKAKVLTSLGVNRFCCRQVFVSHVDLNIAGRYKKN